jgi:hypothetical protein
MIVMPWSPADCAVDYDLVSGGDLIHAQFHTGQSLADSRRVYEDFVGCAGLDRLGVPGDDVDVALAGRFANTGQDLIEHPQLKAIFDYQRQRQSDGPGTGNCQIINRPTNGKFTYVSTVEEQWLDDIAVRGEAHRARIQIQRRRIAQLGKGIVLEVRQNVFTDKIVGKLPAAPVGE